MDQFLKTNFPEGVPKALESYDTFTLYSQYCNDAAEQNQIRYIFQILYKFLYNDTDYSDIENEVGSVLTKEDDSNFGDFDISGGLKSGFPVAWVISEYFKSIKLNFDSMQKQNQQLTESNENLQNQLKESQNNYSNLNQQCIELNNNCNNLNQQYLDLQNEFNQRNQQYSNLENQCNDLSSQCSNIQQELNQRNQQYSDLKNQFDNLIQNNKNLSIENEAKNREALNFAVTEKQNEINNLIIEKNDIIEKCNELNNQFLSLKQESENFKNDYDKKLIELNAKHREEIVSLERDYEYKKQQLESNSKLGDSTIAALNDQIKKYEFQLKSAQELIDENRNKYNEYLQQLQLQIAELENEKQDLIKEYDEKVQVIKNLENIQDTIEICTNKLLNQQKIINDIETFVTQFGNISNSIN